MTSAHRAEDGFDIWAARYARVLVNRLAEMDPAELEALLQTVTPEQMTAVRRLWGDADPQP
jgi:hypothetical protein